MPTLSTISENAITNPDNYRRVTDQQLDWISNRFGVQLYRIRSSAGLRIHNENECSICDDCGNRTITDELSSCTHFYKFDRTTDLQICTDCADDAFTCSDCCQNFSTDDSLYSYNNAEGERICPSCKDNYYECQNCGELIHQDNAIHYYDDIYCEGCYNKITNKIILDYSFKIDTTPMRATGENEKTTQLFGIELEIEADDKEQAAEAVHKIVKAWAVLKEDGSLNDGFEITTRPATLKAHKGLWPAFFNGKPTGLRSYDTDTCGLHIHCGRSTLTELQIAKIVHFSIRAENRLFMEAVAGRSAGRWAEFNEKPLGQCSKTDNLTRYNAVNLQNRDTIEFRIFKGTLKPASFYKALEFCDAIISFTQPTSRSIYDAIDQAKFKSFVMQNKKRWENLAAFIVKYDLAENK